MKLLITEKHLDKAIENVKVNGSRCLSTDCVVAVAAQELLNDPNTYSFWSYISTDNTRYDFIDKVTSERLVSAFDLGKYDQVRDLLPIELKLSDPVKFGKL